MKEEKRRHKRFPVLKDMAEPVDLYILNHPARDVPAILTNLSAGGMALMVFAHVSGDARLKMVLDLQGLDGLELQGRVAWTAAKGETTTVGVHFDHVSRVAVERIGRMAEHYQDCELKISFGVPDVCYRECAYWPLCRKPAKLKS